MKFKNNKSGITLVALIVTIIFLLILAGISIVQLTGNGLFEKAKLAKEKQENAQIEEDETLGNYENEIGEYIYGTREQIIVDKDEYDNMKSQLEFLRNNKNIEVIDTKIYGGAVSYTYNATKKGKVIAAVFTCRGAGGSLGTAWCKKNEITLTSTQNYLQTDYRIINNYIIDVEEGDIITLYASSSSGTWYDSGYSIFFVN